MRLHFDYIETPLHDAFCTTRRAQKTPGIVKRVSPYDVRFHLHFKPCEGPLHVPKVPCAAAKARSSFVSPGFKEAFALLAYAPNVVFRISPSNTPP